MNVEKYKMQIKSVDDIERGDRFGRLVVLEEIEPKQFKNYKLRQFKCKCDCGNTKDVTGKYLVRDETKSCGNCSDKFVLKRSCHYIRAIKILSRCNDPKDQNYYRYGGRGIRCELGDSTYGVIKSLEKVPGYKPGLTIDRIDNDGNYTLYHPVHKRKIWYDEKGRPCRGNLRWVTVRENNMNTSRNVTIKSLATKPREYKDIIKICHNHGWKPEDFNLIRLARKKFLFVLKESKRNDYSERK